eukprot:jgi/Phyca11/112932/e_gw1.23.511.1
MRESAEGEPRVEPHVDEVGEPKPVIPPDKPLGVKADFGDSCLTEEQKSLFQAELDSFSDLLVDIAGTSLLFFGCFYGVVCCYEVVEWICQGWKGLTVLVIAANVYFSAETELDEGRRFSVNPDLLRASWCVLFVGFISHTWRWYEASAGERSPVKVAKDGY